ncbi:MAG: transcription termination factor NusA [Chloroflexi bacterium]|nr:transcription termination factor NusA [Chloroflexota bacterium]
MKSEFVLALNQISAERTLPREVVTRVIEQAIVQAYRKYANIMPGQAVSSLVDMDSGDMRVFVEKEVVESVIDERTEIGLEESLRQKPDAMLGDCIMVDVTPNDLGRIAAQNAKQIIVQKLREAEKDFQFNTFIEREGEIVSGTVTALNSTGFTINLGRIEGQLPKKEMIPGEKYDMQQRVRAYVAEVKRTSRGPQIVLSRAHKNMLKRLLEIEVPEVASGAVEIKEIAREPGSRSKVAVAALQAGVDPVGACVGQRGARIQSIITELRGEKIDIIEWNADPGVFITKALGPAKVMSVHPSVDNKNATVIVPDDQLSLAIGREGQNARLAARLTRWRIDIKSGSEALNEALQLLENDESLRTWIGNDVAQSAPSLRELLIRQRAFPQPLSPEEFGMVKRVIDSVYQWRQSNIEATTDTTASRPQILEERRQAREAAMAAIPRETYGMSLDELGLSARVTQHIVAAGVINVGQLLEYSMRGDEGLLSIPNIGSKALSEIKQALDKVVGRIEAVVEVTPQEAAQVAALPVVGETPEEAQKLFIEAVSSDDDDDDDVIEVDENGVPLADDAKLLPRGKKDKKGKERALVFDEVLGRMVPARTHRRADDVEEIE